MAKTATIDGIEYLLYPRKFQSTERPPLGVMPEWEILELRIPFYGSDNVAFTLGHHGLYETGLNGQVFKRSSRELIASGATITSVKRTSDNTVWSVGEEVVKWGKIESFKIDNVWLNAICNDGLPETITVSIYDLKKLQANKPKDKPQEASEQETEIEKCKKSPYYYATKYLTVNGKPFTTRLTEEEFNKEFLSAAPNWQKTEQPMKERIRVNIGTIDRGSGQRGIPHQYDLACSHSLNRDDVLKISRAAESVLNDEGLDDLANVLLPLADENQLLKLKLQKLQSEYEKGIADAFNAAREEIEFNEPNGAIGYFPSKKNKFKSPEDYLKTINPSKP